MRLSNYLVVLFFNVFISINCFAIIRYKTSIKTKKDINENILPPVNAYKNPSITELFIPEVEEKWEEGEVAWIPEPVNSTYNSTKNIFIL